MDIDKTAYASATLRALEFAFERAGVPIPPRVAPTAAPTLGELACVSLRGARPANDQNTQTAAEEAAARGTRLTPFEENVIADAHAFIDRHPAYHYRANEVYVRLRRGRRYLKVIWLPLGTPDDGSGTILHYVDHATGQVHDSYRRPIPGRVVPGGSDVPAELSAELREVERGLASIAEAETRAELGELRERLTELKGLPPEEASAELTAIGATIEQAQERVRGPEVGEAALEKARNRGIVVVHREKVAVASLPKPPSSLPETTADASDAPTAREPFETQHQKQRRERAERKAAGLERRAAGQFQAARASVEHIPMGQPILVGHHSERRHRRDLARHDQKMRKAVETAEAAKSAEWAAKGAGRSISSDDPEAIEALTAQLASLEVSHALMKAINAAYRKGGWVSVEKVPGVTKGALIAAKQTMVSVPWLKVPMDLKNSAANIRCIKKRIAALETAAERAPAPPIERNGFTITEDPDDNRVRFEFDRRPDKETSKKMKRAGFRFSRTHGAWQRQLNSSGVYAAQRMAKELFGWEATQIDDSHETDSPSGSARRRHE